MALVREKSNFVKRYFQQKQAKTDRQNMALKSGKGRFIKL